MNTLNIDTGLVTYRLNDACEVSFNPTDISFVEKLYKTFEDMDARQKKYREALSAIPESEPRKVFDLMAEKDAEMRAVIDGVFNTPVCDSLFRDINVFALTQDGIPVWANFMLAIIDECNVDADALKTKAHAKIEKYTKKYHK